MDRVSDKIFVFVDLGLLRGYPAAYRKMDGVRHDPVFNSLGQIRVPIAGHVVDVVAKIIARPLRTLKNFYLHA